METSLRAQTPNRGRGKLVTPLSNTPFSGSVWWWAPQKTPQDFKSEHYDYMDMGTEAQFIPWDHQQARVCGRQHA